MHPTLRPLFLVLASVALAAACSSSGTTTTAAPSVAAPSVAAPATTAPSAAAPSEAASEAPSAATGSATISLSTTALGDIIVEEEGKTVYAFAPDSAGTPTCYDQCATTWPPLLAEDGSTPTAGAGLDASKLTTVDRTDGTKQVKYGDWPLYFFSGDSAAGDTNGQGIGTKWYVVDATGAMVK
jgi:predicted lipoprotein with Yx(FWY)xxD motif